VQQFGLERERLQRRARRRLVAEADEGARRQRAARDGDGLRLLRQCARGDEQRGEGAGGACRVARGTKAEEVCVVCHLCFPAQALP
jgi:hypothetical protein